MSPVINVRNLAPGFVPHSKRPVSPMFLFETRTSSVPEDFLGMGAERRDGRERGIQSPSVDNALCRASLKVNDMSRILQCLAIKIGCAPRIRYSSWCPVDHVACQPAVQWGPGRPCLAKSWMKFNNDPGKTTVTETQMWR